MNPLEIPHWMLQNDELKPREMVLLAYLHEVASTKKAKERLKNLRGFSCTNEQIFSRIRYTETQLWEALKALKNNGFLYTKKTRSRPPKRLFLLTQKGRLNIGKIQCSYMYNNNKLSLSTSSTVQKPSRERGSFSLCQSQSNDNLLELTVQLKLAFSKNQKTVLRWDPKVRVRETKILARKFGEDRLLLVGRWYCDNIDQAGRLKLPTQIRSPKGLTNWFEFLEKKMKKNRRIFKTQTITGRRVMDRLSNCRWPNQAKEQLPELIEEGLIVMHAVIQASKKAVGNSRHPLRKLADAGFHELLHSPSQFVASWFERRWDELSSWSAWSGDLSFVAIRLGCDRFETYMLEQIEKVSGSRTLSLKYWRHLQGAIASCVSRNGVDAENEKS